MTKTLTRLPLPKTIEALLRVKAEIEKELRIPNAGDNGGDVVPTVKHGDGKIYVSAEDGGYFANYYGQFDGEDLSEFGITSDSDPWISSKLESWAEARGWHWEWENPGAIMLCD